MQKKDEELLKEIMEQFQRIKDEVGMEPDENYQRELEDLFGMSMEQMNADATIALQTQTVEIELIHEDAIFPSYNYPTDSGFDLYSVDEMTLEPFGRGLVSTGLPCS